MYEVLFNLVCLALAVVGLRFLTAPLAQTLNEWERNNTDPHNFIKFG